MNRHTSRPVFCRGFTLIELLVTIALIGILLALAAPSFTTFQRNSELTTTVNSFIASATAVRAEAMKRGMNAYVVPRTAGNWAGGWVAFVDTDNSATASNLIPSTTDLMHHIWRSPYRINDWSSKARGHRICIGC